MTLPKLNEAQSDVIVSEWLVAVGDMVVDGAPIMVVETDKVNIELESLITGKITALLVQNGDTVNVGQPILEVA